MRHDAGFTLIEVLVAIAILVTAMLGFLGMRTQAVIDAVDARNWRIARELAEAKLSELRAGAHEFEPRSGETIEFEEYEGFSAVVLIGEGAISGYESRQAEDLAFQGQEAMQRSDRLQWQQERQRLRDARRSGMDYQEYMDQLREDQMRREEENRAPSADEFEDVAVVVTFPRADIPEEGESDTEEFVLKARLSTLAISGMTPDRARQWAEARGLDESGSGEGPGSPFGGQGSGSGGEGPMGGTGDAR